MRQMTLIALLTFSAPAGALAETYLTCDRGNQGAAAIHVAIDLVEQSVVWDDLAYEIVGLDKQFLVGVAILSESMVASNLIIDRVTGDFAWSFVSPSVFEEQSNGSSVEILSLQGTCKQRVF